MEGADSGMNLGARANGLQQQIAGRHVFLLSRIKRLLVKRLIVRQLLKMAVTLTVKAGIAHMAEHQIAAFHGTTKAG